MVMTILEIQEELLRQAYPHLMSDEDPDIERYYYLRGMGQAAEALYIFQTRLKPRYPDDELRTALMRCYRNRDPLFKRLLAFAYRQIAGRVLDRVKSSLAGIARRAESYDPRDVYSTIRAAEDILAFLPRERYAAMEGIDRLLRYALALNFHGDSVGKAAELIHSYLGQSLEPVNREIRRRDSLRREAVERERKLLNSPPELRIDLSAVVFSPRDLARIEIPPALDRLEDRTLAYCAKYWNLIGDPVFERTLFLYSRKYGVKNYEVFQLIRRGINGKHRDDEILASVMSTLATGYYYSIRGDHYLQQRWNELKARIQPPAETPAPSAGAAPKPAPPGPELSEGKNAGESPPAGRSRAGKKRPKKGKPKARGKGTKRKIRRKAPPPKPAAGTGKGAPGKTARAGPPQVRAARAKAPFRFPPKAAPIRDGSVAGRLRELSGRSYDLYQDRFLAHARTAIRKIMETGKGLFFNLPETAEDLIYQFLKEHYADPYMNWEGSEAQKKLALMGYRLESLEPVIDECYARL